MCLGLGLVAFIFAIEYVGGWGIANPRAGQAHMRRLLLREFALAYPAPHRNRRLAILRGMRSLHLYLTHEPDAYAECN